MGLASEQRAHRRRLETRCEAPRKNRESEPPLVLLELVPSTFSIPLGIAIQRHGSGDIGLECFWNREGSPLGIVEVTQGSIGS